MSFGGNSALQDHYEHGIKPVVTECGFECIRADEVEHNDRITDKIVGLMRGASFLIADLTDEKPNCYYELGYVHALQKNVIHTINKESALHFDVKDYNFIVYDRLNDLRERLKQRIEATIETKTNDPISAIAAAIERFERFAEEHKSKMLNDRITWHQIQSYNQKQPLPQPFGIELRFHVKDGLQNYSEQLTFNKREGALYRLKAAGYRRKEPTFEGLIRRSEHIDLLIGSKQ
jgi:nucleoside 2-deoxyribosyltransferase